MHLVLLMATSGLITILCHAGLFFPPRTYGDDFRGSTDPELSLHLLPVDNYAAKGSGVTAPPDFSDMPSVHVAVIGSYHSGERSALSLPVADENIKPEITGQDPNPLVMEEDGSIKVTLDHLLVKDEDNQYPEDFTMTVADGVNYTVSGGDTITAAKDFSGMLSVGVMVNDGEDNSNAYALQISVTAVNDIPVITGQTTDPIVIPQDQPLTIEVSHLLISDPDNGPSELTVTATDGVNYTASGSTITPSAGFSGPLDVVITVSDPAGTSEPYTLKVTVEAPPANIPPKITGQHPLSTNEETAITVALADLIVEDPDDDYPGTFSLSLTGGTNYSVSGTQVTPSPDFNGDLAVPVFVNDGTENSAVYQLTITVIPVNDAPTITGQRTAPEIAEGTSLILTPDDLIVEDPDNGPEDFLIVVQAGTDYTFSGSTVTPDPDFTGMLSVNVAVSDGTANSAPSVVQVSVLPVNDPPVITGPETLTTQEDVARTISLADLVVEDPDNADPAGLTLTVFQGENYTLSGNTVLPEKDFSGTLIVPLQVSDGMQTSNVFEMKLSVTPVNDPPVITGQTPLQTAEDVPVTIQLSHLTVLDVDNTYPLGFTLQVSPGTNYTVDGTTIRPGTDFNGTLNISVTVNDGNDNSLPFTLQIQVGNTNDAPLITGQVALSTDEEKPVILELAHLTVSDPDNSYPAGFSILVSPGLNYTVSGQTIIPAVNFSGLLTVPVRVNDGINNSPTFAFALQVNQINDAPSFAPIPDQQVSENAPASTISINDISKGPLEDDQQLTFVATSSNTAVVENPVIEYDGTSATARLTYVLKPNTAGLVTITVVAIDNGSNISPHQNSYSSSFQIEVLDINSAPTINAINNLTLMEDAEQQNVALAGITAGPGETQVLTVAVSSDKPHFFDLLDVAYTSPGSTGLLQFKPKKDIFGTARLTLTVTDDGSGVSPHVNTITTSFSVTIQPVNDPPLFTSRPVVVAAINEAYEYRITAMDPDGENVTFAAAAKPAWATLTPGANGVAILQGKPPAGAAGSVAVTLQVKDATTTVEQAFDIYVNVRPLLTPLSMIIEEDNPAVFPAGFFESGYTDPNDNPLVAIQLTTLPVSGKLFLAGSEVMTGDTIQASSLAGLSYQPDEHYFGPDFLGWNAFDGYHFSLIPARVDLSILPINDPPVIIFQRDTLAYEVNGEPDFIAPLLDIIDPDDDTLSHAVVGFHPRNFHPQVDRLEFENTTAIKASYDFQAGVLTLTGAASVSEYRDALRAVSYLHQNTTDPLLEPKTVYFTVHDGEDVSESRDKVIMLQYTFVELEIPGGFTPNGDNANDTWIINRPGGVEDMNDAIISVYNKRGLLVFRTRGFDRPWDGTMDGELLPADSYFFTIDLQLRNKKTYKGVVTILR